MVYSDGLWVPCDPNKVIKLNPDNSEKLICSRCKKEFVSRGLKDYIFGYILNGYPVYIPRPGILCDECEEIDRRDKAAGSFVGGPLDKEEDHAD